MTSLIIWAAVWLPILVAVAAALSVVGVGRARFVALVGRGAVALVAMVVLMWVAAHVHTDPRPFVVDPSHPALVAHAPDDGFPSDHTSIMATLSLLVATVRRRTGLALLAVGVVAGLARVAANLHHVQDIAAGVIIGAASVAVAVVLWRLVGQRVADRRLAPQRS